MKALAKSAKRARASAGSTPSSRAPTPPLTRQKMDQAPQSPKEKPTIGGEVAKPAKHMPSFLDLSKQEIEEQFQSIQWEERSRIAEAAKNQQDPDFKWGMYKNAALPKGAVAGMDRYFNVKPWNHNRVKLRVSSDEIDYVNASQIELKSVESEASEPLRFIAMQGPTVSSFPHVWRLVAEQTQSPAVIVQLTKMAENGAPKCDQYFPTDKDPEYKVNENDLWNDGWGAVLSLDVDSLELLDDGAIEKRKLLLKMEGEEDERIIWHFLFTKWPDFDVPQSEDLDSFHNLMRVSEECNGTSNPRLVHCSAGIGRTGTFIALTHLMQELEKGHIAPEETPPKKANSEDGGLIYDVVDKLRQQRVGMVQSPSQYQFLYQTLRLAWQRKYAPQDVDRVPPLPATSASDSANLFTGPSKPRAGEVDEKLR